MYQSLVYQVAGVDIREQQDICIALDLAVSSTLMLCSFRINCQIHRQRAIYDTACDLAFFVHLGQLSSFNGNRHLGVYNLNCCQRSNLRTLNTACMYNLYGIFNDMYLIFQGRICHKCNVCQEQQLLNAFYFKTAYVGQRFAGAQTNFLVQNAL